MNIDEIFKDFEITDHAKTAQIEIANRLKENGYEIRLEYYVENRGDEYGGRIDIIATNQHEKVAIEVDQSSPRIKSIFKLKSMDGYEKIVLLRNGNYDFMRDGVQIYSLKAKGVISNDSKRLSHPSVQGAD